MLHQSLSHIASDDEVLIYSHLSDKFRDFGTVFSRHRSKVNHDHGSQERQLFILLVKLNQRNKILLEEVPVAEG